MKNLDSTKLFLEDRYGKKYTNEKLKSMDFVETHAVYEAVDRNDFEALDRLFEIGAGDDPNNSARPGTGTGNNTSSSTNKVGDDKADADADTDADEKPDTGADKQKKPAQSSVNKKSGSGFDARNFTKGDTVEVKNDDGTISKGKVKWIDHATQSIVISDEKGKNRFLGHNQLNQTGARSAGARSAGEKVGNTLAPPPNESVELARIKELAGIEETTCAGGIASVATPVTRKPIKRIKEKKKRDPSKQ